LKRKDDTIVLISDNGIGFNTNLKKRIGLQNMISRHKSVTEYLMFPLPKGRATITVTIPTEQKTNNK
jgi:signal transduction histidine kinase